MNTIHKVYTNGIIMEPTLHDAWIKPDGTFISVNTYGHSLFAREYVGDMEAYDAVTDLETLGWQHISGGWIVGMARNGYNVTDAQYDTLFAMYKQAKADTGVFAREFVQAFDTMVERFYA